MTLSRAYGGGGESAAERLTNHSLSFSAQVGINPGISIVRKFGCNPDIDSGTIPETIWPESTLYPTEASDYPLEVVSSDVSDTAVGAGMQTVQVEGLDANFDEQKAIVTLNGTTPVAVPGLSWRRTFRVFGLTSGGVTNVGTITARIPGPGNTEAVIAPTDGQSLQAVFTIPAGRTGFIFEWNAVFTAATPNAGATVVLRTKENLLGTEPVRVRSVIGLRAPGSSQAINKMMVPIKVPEKTDIAVTVTAASPNSGIASEFGVMMIETKLLP